MESSTGRWVSGDDFFDRESELRVLESRVRGGNHVLLTGQRRMGKTSIARELARKNHRFSSRGRQDAVVAGRTDLKTLKA